VVAPEAKFIISSELRAATAPLHLLLHRHGVALLLLLEGGDGAAELRLLFLACNQILHDHVLVDLVSLHYLRLLLFLQLALQLFIQNYARDIIGASCSFITLL